MKNLKYLIMLMVLPYAQPTFANHPAEDMRCIKEKWTLVKTEKNISNECIESRKLSLKEGLFIFPKINVGPLKVRYWDGQYEKQITQTDTYKHDYINICTGILTYSSEESFEEVQNKTFNIQNPNLDFEITKTYELAPMTDDEAKFAFGNLKIECEAK